MKRNRIRSRLGDRWRNREAPHRAADSLARSEPQDVPGPLEGGRPSADDEVLSHLSGLLDSVKTAIISLDGEGRVRVFNAVAEMLFSLPRQAVLGRPFTMVGRTSEFKDHAVRALWERLSDAMWAAGAALDLEYDLVRPQGQKRVILYSVYPIGRLPWSVGNGVVILLEDITRRKELEEQIYDGRKRLQAVFDGITDGIQVVDRDFRITAVNKSMTTLAGGGVVIGNYCYRICASGSGVCDECPALVTFQTGQPATIIKRLPRPPGRPGDGDDRILEISTFPLLDRGGRVLQVVEYLKEVTERIELAERLEHARRLAALGEMAARVAHEVRNPLNAITGAAHYLAAEYASDETIQKFTSLIKRQSDRVDQVASDILHASRPLRLNRTRVDVAGVVDQAINALEDRIREQGIAVERRSDTVPVETQGDEVQIEQAVFNIIKNAVEAMPGGGVLRVETARNAQDRWITIAVEDSGCGIQAGDRERIFEAFYTTKANGTGLGLSIVEGVLKNHGGTISIERPERQGTRIVLRFPAAAAGDTAPSTGGPVAAVPRTKRIASSPQPLRNLRQDR